MLEQNHLRGHIVRIRPLIPCHEVIVSSGIYSLAKHENISMLGVVCMIYMKGLLCDQGFEGDG